MEKGWLSSRIMPMNSWVPPNIKPEWFEGLCHKSLATQTSDEMKLYECVFWVFHIIRLISTLREVENHCSAKTIQNFPTLSSELLTKQDSNSLHFSFFYFFSPFCEGLLHIEPQTQWGLWNESTWHSGKGNFCHYQYNLGGLDNQSGYSSCWQVPVGQDCPSLFSISTRKIRKLPCSSGPCVPPGPYWGTFSARATS